LSPVVDGSSIKDFEPVEGTFECVFASYENKKAKDNTDNINMVFEVNAIEHPDMEGRKFFVTKNLKPQALWSLKQTCVRLGADPELFAGEFDTDEILTDLIGEPCRIKASLQTEGEYAGRQQVDDVLAAGYALKA